MEHTTANGFSALEAKIVAACAQLESTRWTDPEFRQAVCIGTDYFVKFGNLDEMYPEIRTQQYIHGLSVSSCRLGAPRIPRVEHVFERGVRVYVVMEYIDIQSAAPLEAVNAAVVWLASVPAPAGHTLGPLGGGPIGHPFFKDWKAPLLFSSVEALERYIAKAYTLVSSWGNIRPVTIRDDKLMFSQSDMDDSNFGIDERGNTVLMDFGMIGLLPQTFVAYTLSGQEFASSAAALNLSDEFCDSMSVMRTRLWMTADDELGLDVDGNPKTRRRK